MIIIIALLTLFIYGIITYISKRFFSKAIEEIKIKLNLNQVIASTTILAFANALPDILTSSASDKNLEGSYFVLSTLISNFLFCTSVTASFVIYSSKSKSIKLSSLNMIKEILIYLVILASVLY